MPISRLGGTITDTETTPATGVLLYTATGTDLVSVIATNTLIADAQVYVLVVPSDAAPGEFIPVTYNLPVSGYNTYETFRFAMNAGDELYVAGSANVAYYVQGISQ